MRWNEAEIASLAWDPNWTWEGKLTYKPPKSSKTPKLGIFQTSSEESRERWCRLRANFLFYFRLSQNGGRPALASEPMGILVLENFHVQPESFENPNAFSIIFKEENGPDKIDKKHLFTASNERDSKQWQNALKGISYRELRDKLVNLQILLRQKTNSDPLKGTAFECNPLFCPLETKVESIFFDDKGPPKPKPRKPKSHAKSSFQSHVVENWESHSPHNKNENSEENQEENPKFKDQKKPSFQSHVPTANLIDF